MADSSPLPDLDDLRRAVRQPAMLLWLLPVFMWFFVRREMHVLQTGCAGLIGLALVLRVAKRPDTWILRLLVLLPFQQMILSYVFSLGVGVGIVKNVALWKEVVVAGVALAGVRAFRADGRHLDTLDKFGLAYVVAVLAYALLPTVFVHAPTVLTDSTALSVSFRANAAFVILFFAARHAPLGHDFGLRLARTLLWTGALVAAVGVFEFLFPNSWNDFVIERIQLLRYRLFVQNQVSRNYTDIGFYSTIGGRDVLRIGSVFVTPLAAGPYLVVPFAIGVEFIARRMRSGAAFPITILCGVGIILTQTRAALLAALIVLGYALARSPSRNTETRVRLALGLAAGLVLLAPVAVSSGVVDRTSSAAAGQEESASEHLDSTRAGIDALLARPLGTGLGTGGNNGLRFAADSSVISEDYYLQIGNETGVQSMVLFIGVVVLVNRALRRRLNEPDAPLLASAARGWWIGLGAACLLLHIYGDVGVAWTAWAPAGVALATVAGTGREQPRRYTPALARR